MLSPQPWRGVRRRLAYRRRLWIVIDLNAAMFAALGVWGSASGWPDLLAAAGMAGLFLWSSVQIVAQAPAERRAAG